MVRGLERREIFADDVDRQSLCVRLSSLLEETGTQCFAWALIPNHFHLLLRTSEVSLATFMRRLLTGYAVSFNLRHQRAGRLFQNRYKSIVCEEEEYLLELVRYIHLNPIRAGQVADMAALAKYPWSGHAVALGHRELPGQAVGEVLGRFGRRVREAQAAYEVFVGAGVEQGSREEFSGGGLRRSLAFLGRSDRRESYDARILGTGAFVEQLRRHEGLRERVPPPLSIRDLVERVAQVYGVTPERVLRRSTKREVADARGVVSCVAVRWLGARGTEVGRVLGLTDSGVSRSVGRGQQVFGNNPEMLDRLLSPAGTERE
jgi:REP element-mobilizing transposase RayT